MPGSSKPLLFLAGLALVGCSSAPSTPSAELNAQSASAAADEEIICTTEYKTGSRMPRKVCLTKSERDRLAMITEGANAARRDRGIDSSRDLPRPGTGKSN